MGTTTGLGLPYPEGTDLVISGDDAIEALARAVESSHRREWASVASADSASTFASGGSTLVSFPGATSLNGFTFDGVTLTRVGYLRLFMVNAQVSVQVSSGGSSALAVSAAILANGAPIAETGDVIESPSNDLTSRQVAFNLTTFVGLTATDTITVQAGGGGGSGTVGAVRLSVEPLGPVFAS